MELSFEIDNWLGSSIADPRERATLAALRITAGPNHIPLTEVEDTLARTVRSTINVSVYPLVRWLLANWWRLRWEPRSQEVPSPDWLAAHSLAAIGEGYSWPDLQLASDGEFVQLRLQAEMEPDVSAIRYLRDVTVDIPLLDFDRAVERLVDQVEARLGACLPSERELTELRQELREELADPQLAQLCKLQALAGVDPGAASEEWLDAACALVLQAGPTAGEEVLATVPSLKGGLEAAKATIAAMRSSPALVKLDWATLPLAAAKASASEVPWQRGARLAGELRQQLGLTAGPLARQTLEDLLEVKLPLARSAKTGETVLRGGFRNGVTNGRTALLVTSHREDNQRFYLARLVGAALLASPEQHVLPVSDMDTALQKFERSFAQELLCPWSDLDAFTSEHGLDDGALADAAEHFMVSEWTIRSTLVNKKKLQRDRHYRQS